jgi:GNAT superfamily N-acetyltransferase
VDVAPRAAGSADLDGFVETLTASFLDDPVMSWAFPDRHVRARRLRVLWRYVAGGIYLPAGRCTTLPAHDAVAMWREPGAAPADAFWAEHAEAFATELEGDLERMSLLSETMAAHHPTDAHWYLLALGTRPDAQGRGLGSVLLAHTLAVADEQGQPAYLEATSPRSRALYARFGFDVVDELTPPGGPPLWAMWRTPT